MTAAPVRWVRAWTAYWRIGPLWTALHRAVPEIALSTPTTRLRPAFPRGAEFALYRRIIEIHDGLLALRPYVHPGVHTWAVATAGGRARAATRRPGLRPRASRPRWPPPRPGCRTGRGRPSRTPRTSCRPASRPRPPG
ncbi:DUF6545 domain-containing protein [Kitasatospora gansuensis]